MAHLSTVGLRTSHVPWLTEPSKVADYLVDTPFRSINVRRIKSGTTNYTYRISLSVPWGERKHETAVLKFAAPYMAGEPDVAFSAERLTFEASALHHIPWQKFPQPRVLGDQVAEDYPRVTLPEIFFHDAEHHVLIMEDCAPRAERLHFGGGGASSSLRQFLNKNVGEAEDHATLCAIGTQLGAFLGQLQAWSLEVGPRQTALDLFGTNESAKEVIIRESCSEFFTNLEKVGYKVEFSEEAALRARLCDLERSIENNCQSVAMGDFWSGNVLLDINSQHKSSRLTIIDWEFVTMGPAFVDVGNFIRELFLNNYFESHDSRCIVLLKSFLDEYHSCRVPISIKDALGFAAARAMWSLARRVSSPTSKVSKSNVLPCVQELIAWMMHYDHQGPNDSEDGLIDNLVQNMRQHIHQTQKEKV